MNNAEQNPVDRTNLPPGLQEGGSWLQAIREEVRKELTLSAYAIVLQEPPWFLRWLLRPWLRFQLHQESEEQK